MNDVISPALFECVKVDGGIAVPVSQLAAIWQATTTSVAPFRTLQFGT